MLPKHLRLVGDDEVVKEELEVVAKITLMVEGMATHWVINPSDELTGVDGATLAFEDVVPILSEWEGVVDLWRTLPYEETGMTSRSRFRFLGRRIYMLSEEYIYPAGALA